jgi:hypothetical protein
LSAKDTSTLSDSTSLKKRFGDEIDVKEKSHQMQKQDVEKAAAPTT